MSKIEIQFGKSLSKVLENAPRQHSIRFNTLDVNPKYDPQKVDKDGHSDEPHEIRRYSDDEAGRMNLLADVISDSIKRYLPDESDKAEISVTIK